MEATMHPMHKAAFLIDAFRNEPLAGLPEAEASLAVGTLFFTLWLARIAPEWMMALLAQYEADPDAASWGMAERQTLQQVIEVLAE